MSVLVDTSVWVAWLRGQRGVDAVDALIDDALLVTNDLILAELIPALLVKRRRELVDLFQEIPRLPLEIEWNDIIRLQVTCLRHGINQVGIPDLILVQHAVQNNLSLFTLDRHFRLIGRHVPLDLY
ncbi:MAG: PIN domain-containing protein [Candidatus Sumerlaeota bacterium]|nr:PIN domain-containing protein [Candidatus Sumerlaeota bacterium]